jgi:hypothetical protein
VRVSPSHDVVGVALGQRVARLVQRRRQAGLADDERRAARALGLEEAPGRERRGPDRLLGDLEPARAQPGGEVAPRVDRVVREDEERDSALAQGVEEAGGAADGLLLVHEHAVHVHQPGADLARGHGRGA